MIKFIELNLTNVMPVTLPYGIVIDKGKRMHMWSTYMIFKATKVFQNSDNGLGALPSN